MPSAQGSSAQRCFRCLFALLFALFSSPPANIRAESSHVVELPPASPDAATVYLPLDSGEAPSEFRLQSAEEVTVTLGAAGGGYSRQYQLHHVQAADGKRGVIVLHDGGPEGGRGYYGAFVQAPPGEDHIYYQMLPLGCSTPGGGELHEIERIDRTALAAIAGLGTDVLAGPFTAGAPIAFAAEGEAYSDTDFWREIELLVDVSSDFSQGRPAEETAAHVMAVIAGANLFFENLRLRLRPSAIEIRADEDLYLDAASRGDAHLMLELGRAYWAENPHLPRDIVAVLGGGRYGGYFGLAYPGAACLFPDYSILFAAQGGQSASRVLGLAATLAHETGHLIGMTHDLTGYSVMSPYYISSPAPFSAQSAGEFAAHGRRGGADCFSPIDAPVEQSAAAKQVLTFRDGNQQSLGVLEGQRLEHVFAVDGAVGELYFRATGLPAGAKLDSARGTLIYQPDFNEAQAGANRVYPVLIEVFSANRAAALNLELVVVHVNRAPAVVYWGAEMVTVEQGGTFVLAAGAVDPDAGDWASVDVVNQAVLRDLPGRKRIERGASTLVLSWEIAQRASGIFRIELEARDQHGASARRIVNVGVVASNKAPLFFAPQLNSAENGQPPSVRVEASDPEGSRLVFDFTGAPPGTVVRYAEDGLDLRYAPANGALEQARMMISASDGWQTVRTPADLAADAKWGARLWPGAARNVDAGVNAQAKATFYQPHSGNWQDYDCRGQAVSAKQFGGFIGDLPLEFQVNGRKVAAVYRTIAGLGYWFIDAGSGTKVESWGLADDLPVPGDFDGDGTSDLGAYSPRQNNWRIRFTTMPAQILTDTMFGADTEPLRYPFAADVDGDGLDDRVFFVRKSDGAAVFEAWLARGEHWAFVVGKESIAEVLQPFHGDFDGDLREDFGIISASGSIWFFLSESGKVLHQKRALARGGSAVVAGCESASRKQLLNFSFSSGLLQVLSPDGDESTIRTLDYAVPDGGEQSRGLILAERMRFSRCRVLRRVRADRDSNGRTDLTAWRQETASWGRVVLKDPGGAETGYLLPGSASGASVNGYFDGYGSSLGRFEAGRWLLIRPDGSLVVRYWGQEGDVPVAADYNGDGRDDLAVWRPADSMWWILLKNAGQQAEVKVLPWGEPGDIPVPEDYDGDGAADIAVFRPKTGTWYVVLSHGAVITASLNLPGLLPVPGDYFGEGRAAPAAWQGSGGLWYIGGGGSHRISVEQWGLAQDAPLRGDFNGDGRAELGVWRASSGRVYLRTLDSLLPEAWAVQFGLAKD